MSKIALTDQNIFSGNEMTRGDEIWKIAYRYNKQSVKINGYVTSQRRKNVELSKKLPLT